MGGIMDDPKSAFKGVFADADSFNKRIKLMWLGAGSGETQFVKMVDDTKTKLSDLGIKPTTYISQGTFPRAHLGSISRVCNCFVRN
jgi:enterochelin esterase family protein